MLIAYQYDKMPRKTWTPIVFIFIVMTLFIELRDASVGTDTAGYARSFTSFSDLDSESRFQWDKEPGFWLLVTFSQMIGSNYAMLLSLIAGLTYASVLTVLKKHSDSLLISLFVYIAFATRLSV